MKFYLSLVFVLASTFSGQLLAKLSIGGTYQGKNLYIQNPKADDGFGFCATKVTVNGDVMPGGTASGAFEIDFSSFDISVGDPVFIEIDHHDGCKPKILNPEVLLPLSTYTISSIKIDNSGKLTWSTTGEKGKLPFIIEQYRWNKWVAIGEVDGVGTEGLNKYEFKVAPHSGENKVRVAQIDHSGNKKASGSVTFKSSVPVVTKTPAIVEDKITFSSETRYEIYDAYGNIVKKGVGTSVDCTNLIKGVYYINYDNRNEKFVKK